MSHDSPQQNTEMQPQPPLIQSAPQAGQRLKGYEILEHIGGGGFGDVYRALDPVLGREVAIKVLQPQIANQSDFIRRFEVEARLVAHLEHPHIVPLYDYWREPAGAYLVMRYLRGGSLREVLAKTPLPIDRIVRYIDQIASALMLAHQNGVIHRDLKPDNILLDEHENAYLADFGIAVDLSTPQGTQTQGALTPLYAAPEQFRGTGITPQTDIYCLGLMLYEMFTGQHPFHGDITVLILRHLQDPIPSVHTSQPIVPSEVDDVLQKATAKDPAQRYENVSHLVDALKIALAISDLPSSGHFSTLDDGIQLANPYKGLRAFQEADAEEFFGREALIQRLLDRFAETGAASRLLAVVGPSGSGKSSVVKAGLIPALRAGALEGSDNWFMVEMVPGTHPLEELEAALLKIAIVPPVNLYEQLQSDSRGLARAIKQVLPGGEDSQLVLFIDQFEEVFTLSHDEAARTLFIESLISALEDERGHLRVILTLRADFYDKPLQYLKFGELLRQRVETVLPLSPLEMEAAILEPAQHIGVGFEPGLVQEIIKDVGEQPGTLPLLQYTLTELFEHREGRLLTFHAYHEIGGVIGSLARRADEVFLSLTEMQQDTVRQVFLRLIALGDVSEDTRRRVKRSELAFEHVEPVLQAYGKARLLTFDRDPTTREQTVEVAHEALLRTWERLREWVDHNRDNLRIHRRLTLAAQEWSENAHKPEFLAATGPLAQFEALIASSELTINEQERTFFDASVARHQEQQAEAIARERREAALVRRSRNVLRGLVAVLLVATVVALGFTKVAVDQGTVAQDNAATATFALGETERERAISDANLRAQWNTEALFLADLSRQEAVRSPQTALMLALESLSHYSDGIFRYESRDALLNALSPRVHESALYRHDARVRGAIWDSERQQILSWSDDRTARLWSLADPTADPVILLHREAVLGAVWNYAHTQLMTWDAEGVVRIWQSDDFAAPPLILRHSAAVNRALWSRDDQQVLTWAANGELYLWNLNNPSEARIFSHAADMRGMLWSADETTVFTWAGNEIWLWNLAQPDEPTILTREGAVLGVLASAVDQNRLVSWSQDGIVNIWDVRDLSEPVTTLTHDGAVDGALWSEDETRLVTWSMDKTVRVWTLDQPDTPVILTHDDRLRWVSWDADETRLVTWAANRTLRIWDLESPDTPLATWINDRVRGITWDETTMSITWWTEAGLLNIWPVEMIDATLKARVAYQLPHGALGSAAWNADRTQVFTYSDDGTVRIWDMTSTAALPILDHSNEVRSAYWNLAEDYILTASEDGTAKLWNMANLSQPTALQHNSDVWFGAWNSTGSRFFTTSFDGSVRVFSMDDLEKPLTFNHEADQPVWHGLWNAQENLLSTWSDDDTARVWNLDDPDQSLILQHDDNVTLGVFNHASTHVVSTSRDGTAKLWQLEDPSAPIILQHDGPVNSAEWSEDDSQIVTWSDDGTAKVWRLADLDSPIILKHDAPVFMGQFSKDGKRVLTASWDDTAHVWDLDQPDSPLILPHENDVYGAVWSEDETKVLSWSWDHTARVWTLADPSHPIILTHNHYVRGATWNADETKVLTWSWDGTARVWNLDNLDDVLVLRHGGTVWEATWSQDETRVLTASQDGTARIWVVDIPSLIQLGQSRQIRPLTNLERSRFFLPTVEASPVASTPTRLPTLTPSPTVPVTPTATP